LDWQTAGSTTWKSSGIFTNPDAEDWEETAGVIAQYADDLADELKIRGTLDKKLVVEYAGVFECTAYCTEKYQHICGTGTCTPAPLSCTMRIPTSSM